MLGDTESVVGRFLVHAEVGFIRGIASSVVLRLAGGRAEPLPSRRSRTSPSGGRDPPLLLWVASLAPYRPRPHLLRMLDPVAHLNAAFEGRYSIERETSVTCLVSERSCQS